MSREGGGYARRGQKSLLALLEGLPTSPSWKASRRAERGLVVLSEGQEGSGVPPERPGGVGRPF